MHNPPAAQRLRIPVILSMGIPAVFLVVIVAAVVSSHSGPSRPAPAPITRAELVSEYFTLVPDPNATPDDVVNLADTACERLDSGVAPDTLISNTTSIYHSRARAEQVLALLVSYGCPSYHV